MGVFQRGLVKHSALCEEYYTKATEVIGRSQEEYYAPESA